MIRLIIILIICASCSRNATPETFKAKAEKQKAKQEQRKKKPKFKPYEKLIAGSVTLMTVYFFVWSFTREDD